MGLVTFRGGIHPYDGKELSKDCKIQEILPKGNLIFPLSQHIGAPATPVVKKGDYVLVGQKIGEASGFISANVISSVSGTVKSIEPKLTVSGDKINSIIIENDEKYETIENFGQHRDESKLSKEEIRNIIKEAGIVGMGGAGFPTHVKLTPKDDSKIEYVIVNAAECEPYITADYRMMLEEPEKIIKGLKIQLSLFENAKGIIAIEDNKPEAITKLQELTKGEPKIEVVSLKTKYPQGGERLLIYATTGRKINSSMLPSDVGCIVSNVDSVASVYMAVCETTPLIRRIVTVTGDAIKTPMNLHVKIGTSYTELIDFAGGFKTKPEKVISGGPMMGNSLYSLEVPVSKTSSAILALTKDEVAMHAESACIRCGKCISVCPSNIIPQKMMECAENNDSDGFERLHGMECCECGCCTYVCPAKRRMTQAFREMRRSIIKARRKS